MAPHINEEPRAVELVCFLSSRCHVTEKSLCKTCKWLITSVWRGTDDGQNSKSLLTVSHNSGVISSVWLFCTVNRFQYITCAEIYQTAPEQCCHWLQSDWMMGSNCLKHHKQRALPAGCVGLPVIISCLAAQRWTMTAISETNAPPNIKDLTWQLSNYQQSLIQGVSAWNLEWMNQRRLLPAQVKL